MNSKKFQVNPWSCWLLAALVVAPVAVSAAGPSAVEVALDYYQQRPGLASSDVAEVTVSSEVLSRHTGVTHVYLQQRYQGLEVYGGIVNVNVDADGTVLSAGDRTASGLTAAVSGTNATLTAVDAVNAAAAALDLEPTRPFELLSNLGGDEQATTISDGGIAERSISAGLVWFPGERGVRLAWRLEIEQADGAHWWDALVDAGSGELLVAHDLIIHDSAEGIAAAVLRLPGSASGESTAFPSTDGAAYQVFPTPLESPSDGGRQLVTDAADPSASPYGWHDTDGVEGPEFTVTRGNNVHAYTDRDANNAPDPGSDPDGGATLTFDFPLDLSAPPVASADAMVTNLFYWNNIMHDVAYNYGFDEAAGNFQVNNYGNGGLGADYVRAEAQDGSGRNNANFGTPRDGFRPRMQMFEWRSRLPNPITVAPPSPIAGTFFGPMAGFGPALGESPPLTGEVVVINDGVGTPGDGCQPFAIAPGTIPLIDRGACTFVTKVKNAQNTGAAVAIVANNIGTPPFGMGGSDSTITIPSVMISLADGNQFKANLPLTVTIEDGTGGAPDRDSDVDNGIIAHEYGHGISNRLTGGPGTVACLRTTEQMGEGWSDWFALTLTANADDRPTTARGVGTYAIFQDPDGDGIRPTPYTVDTSVNPSSYASVADVVNISRPHGIGYVWNTMLWEVYWNLVDRYGFNPNVHDDYSTGGNNLTLQLGMDGMKLQPCGPGFEDGRDGVLQADAILTGGANQCEIWRGFAKRGLGASASQGSPNDRTDGIEAFDLPASCTAAVFGGFEAPVADSPTLNSVNAGSTVPVKFTLSGVGSAPIVDSQPVDCATLVPTGKAPSALVSPGSTGLVQQGDEYHVNWQTDASWAGTCRRVTLRIPAASDAVAYFSFQ